MILDGEQIATGVRQDAETVAKAMAEAREGLSVQLEAFAAGHNRFFYDQSLTWFELSRDDKGMPVIAMS